MATVTHTVRRLGIDLPGGFQEVTDTYEALVPALDLDDFNDKIRSLSWGDIVEWTRQSSRHGFLRYWRNDVRALMRRAGDDHDAIAYLMGNHVTAERMFRFEPRVMNYAPLRVEISRRSGEPVVFTADIPSDHFGSFGIPELQQVGRELDVELADLLVLLGADAQQLDELRGPST